MSKGKRMAETNSIHSKKLRVFKAIIFLLSIILLISIIYYFINVHNNKSTETSSSSYQIDSYKSVSGLDYLKILNVEVNSSNNMSIINIYLDNTSDKSVTSQKVHFYLLDDNGSIVFGSTLKLPNIEPNSQIDFSIACSTDIQNVVDYELVCN